MTQLCILKYEDHILNPRSGPKTLLVKFQMEKPKSIFINYIIKTTVPYDSYDAKFSVSTFVLQA